MSARLKLGLLRALIFLVALGLVFALNQPTAKRLGEVRRALAEAGFPEAEVGRSQEPVNTSECGVGQITNRGYAYGWASAKAKGVYCYPTDGRPRRIILHTPKGAFFVDPGRPSGRTEP